MDKNLLSAAALALAALTLTPATVAAELESGTEATAQQRKAHKRGLTRGHVNLQLEKPVLGDDGPGVGEDDGKRKKKRAKKKGKGKKKKAKKKGKKKRGKRGTPPGEGPTDG